MVNLNNSINNKIHVYPNPCFDYLKVQCTNFKDIQVYVYDLHGRLLSSAKGFKQNQIDLL